MGIWKPILEKIKEKEPEFEKNKAFKRDMFNVSVGIVAQTLLVIIPLYLILHQHIHMLIAIGILVICAIILKKTWWNKLQRL